MWSHNINELKKSPSEPTDAISGMDPMDTGNIKSISIDHYANYELEIGEKIFKYGNIWWRKLREGFYRPILPYLNYNIDSIRVPKWFYIGGYQFSIDDSVRANSRINYFVFKDTSNYTKNNLKYNIRRQINIGNKNLNIHEIDKKDFLLDGYETYVSFYNRTQYGWKKERLDKNYFENWSDILFSEKNFLRLGAYFQDKLVGIVIVVIVERVAIVMSSFSHTDYLKYYVYDVLLHEIRNIIRSISSIEFIYYGNYCYNKGLDESKSIRGASLISSPAYCYMNPIVKTCLSIIPNKYMGKIIGKLN